VCVAYSEVLPKVRPHTYDLTINSLFCSDSFSLLI
jgi:hypothetical protein